MQDPDLLTAHRIGAALSLTGLAVLMLGEAGEPQPLGTATGCLVAALAAFAVDVLRRGVSRRTRRPAAGRRRALLPGQQAAPAVPAVSAIAPAPAAPEAGPPDAVTAGRWAMPATQRDPRVHAALSMAVARFRSAGPPAADGGPGRGPNPEPDDARRAALADVRNRRLARRG